LKTGNIVEKLGFLGFSLGRLMNNMDALYLKLAILLQNKEQESVSADINRVKDRIRDVANLLRQNSVVDAAFAYYVAGYYVRASRLIPSEMNDDTHLAQRLLALFIAKRFENLEERVRDIALDDNHSDKRLREAILHQGLSDSEALDRMLIRRVADAFDVFMKFVKDGDETRFEVIHSTLARCQQVVCKAQEWRWWWWLEFIRLVMDEFVTNCLWSQLKPMRQENCADQIVSRYIIANYERRNPVVELWRTQIESLGKVNDPERRSFCLTIPTGAGKTRVAELSILRFFLDYRDNPGAKCVYIAPLRKLANEVEQTLSPVFAHVTSNPRVVSSFYGGQEVDLLDQDELAEARVLIVTPEKLDGMLRHNPMLHSQIRLVVADEGHMIGDDSPRGYKYRMLLERLVYALRIKSTAQGSENSRLLFVSGVLPNVSEFAKLISGDSESSVSVDWRPLDEPLKGYWEWDGGQMVASNSLPQPPIPFRAPACSSPNKFEEAVVRAAFTHAMSSPTMVFSASKKAIKSNSLVRLLECLLDQQPLLVEEDPLPSKLSRQSSFGEYYSLLEQGVAIHHSDIPAALKNETEVRVYDGRVKLLFASPTLAQGVNIPFDTVLIYRLQHYIGNAIYDATFWNVVGRVGRPMGSDTSLRPPQVVFLINKSLGATQEDKLDVNIGKHLLSQEKRYRVASPFLQFLNRLEEKWKQKTGQPIAELIQNLAEKPDLQWIPASREKRELARLLSLLDEHLIALIEESNLDEDEVDDWLQERSSEVINLLTQATTIKPSDLDFIKEAIQARAKFVIKHIPRRRRRQDYLLGLPFEDCERIRAKQDTLLNWYQGCADIFARHFDSGIDNLIQILDFVSSLSICPKKWRRKKREQPLFDHSGLEAQVSNPIWKRWILGEDTQVVASIPSQKKPDADFDKYREEMLEGSLAWGVSAVCKFLDGVAQEKGLNLTKDLEFLPSLVKYGAPGKLSCYLVRLKIPREAAVKIVELYVSKVNSDDSIMFDMIEPVPTQAKQAIKSLTEEDILSLSLNDAVIDRVKEIKRHISR
jgi:hypothetical protein